MEPVKVVIRYLDGRVMKGFTQDFLPNKDRFHLHHAAKSSGESVEVMLKDLKAIFFVQDFEGNAQYSERKSYGEGERAQGRKVEVTFADDEMLVGSTMGYDPNRPGFFIFPADPKSNNIRVFAVSSSVKKVRNL
ncbi:MAG: hypothetical protein A2162_02660 [Deltaproteobacteria bacterium RBG_13_52_11b]|nr:MAG: hypothetical protein A2162_02660 [Deltaproteobacteria bacterium RBG_13_52_11b]